MQENNGNGRLRGIDHECFIHTKQDKNLGGMEMTRLDCTVKTCIHNAENCCCKNGILVEGVNARNSGDTSCGSFEERKGNSFRNLFKTPESKLHVECDVTECLYNDDQKCRAEKITFKGDGARAVGQTECSSFRKK